MPKLPRRLPSLLLTNLKLLLVEMLPRFKRNERFYHLYEQMNLFGGISLVCAWGTFDSRRGGHKLFICNNSTELKKKVSEICKVRRSRGYVEY